MRLFNLSQPYNFNKPYQMDFAIKILKEQIHKREVEKRVWTKQARPDIVLTIMGEIQSLENAIQKLTNGSETKRNRAGETERENGKAHPS